jgi:hypothetical protein
MIFTTSWSAHNSPACSAFIDYSSFTMDGL